MIKFQGLAAALAKKAKVGHGGSLDSQLDTASSGSPVS